MSTTTTPDNWLLRSLELNPTPPELALPRRYASLGVDNLPPETALTRKAQAYIRDFWTAAPRGLAPTFLGAVRSGKTETAAVIAKIIRASGVEVLFVDLGETLCRLDRDRFSSATAEEIRRIKVVPFLVMDDFTCVERGSWGAQLLGEVISERFGAQQPTLWTGNIPVDPIAPFDAVSVLLGSHFARRLEDGSRGYTVLVG